MVRDLTEDYGADVYLDASGHPSAVPRASAYYANWGAMSSTACSAPVTVDWTIISDVKELDVLGAHLGPYCWPTAIGMIEAKKLPLDRICSHQLPLDRICSHQLPLYEFREGIEMVGRGAESVKGELAARLASPRTPAVRPRWVLARPVRHRVVEVDARGGDTR